MTTDLKTSLLVNQQVPEYVREEYPTFIAFLEAYYEFLETKQGTEKNDLITQAKKLKNISDVDDSIEEFEQSFYNTYGSLIPLDVQSDKALLFKHLLPLYKIKGSESSFKLLFRLVFGQDIDIILPRNNVLKVSNSNWVVDNKLRINTDVYTQYVGDGSTKEFILAQVASASDITVYINDVEQIGSFFVKREYRRIIFNTAPTNNSVIKVVYDNFNEKLFQNRKVTGLTSGASAIIELSNRRIISDVLNLGLPIELLINPGSLEGDFLNGEFVTIPIIDADGILLDVRASTFSIVKQINIINAGYNYKVGDPISVVGGNAKSNAVATVDSIFSGAINRILVFHGGATFTNASTVLVSGNTPNSVFTITVDGIDQTGVNAANTFIVSTDVIEDYKNTLISAADYGFPNANNPTGENVNTRIIDSLSYDVLQVGPITNVKITLPTSVSESTPILDGFGATYGPPGAFRTAKSLGTIARFKINNGGLGYAVGDEIVFGSNPPMTFGQSAAAVVTKVAANGYIQKIEVANARISGTATISTSGVVVSGTGTNFTTELKVGDTIDINNQSRVIATITDPITMSVTAPWTYASTNKKIGVFNYYPKGGFGYVQNNFPTITVSSAGGANANIAIDSIASDNEQLQGSASFVPGAILTVKVLVPGSGYEFIPIATPVSTTGQGAVLSPQIERSYVSADGRWTTSDSLLSTSERKIAGREYYVDYSYVISSRVEFYKYKKILKDLLHPVGFVNYAEYQKSNSFNSTIDVQPSKEVTLSGRVNVSNGSVVVTGFSTKFNIANQNNILTPGSRIAVNGELRTVNSIVSNTVLITSSNLTDIWIANSGSGYSNGSLNISNGGGTITTLTIGFKGLGYSNGILLFSEADQSISAVANCEVFPSNGALRRVTLTSGGLFSNRPIALPDSYPANVISNGTITITNPGAGYSNGFLNFSDGDPLRVANVRVEVFPSNGGIRTVTTVDPGSYKGPGFPTVTPNTSANVVIFAVNVTSNGLGHSNGVLTFTSESTSNRAAQVAVEVDANGSILRTTILDNGLYTSSVNVASITANAGATGVNSFVIFTGGGTNKTPANAQIYVNTAGYIVNVVISSNGTYVSLPTATVNTGNGVLTVITQPTITATVNNTPLHVSSFAANTATGTPGRAIANGYIVFTEGNPVINANVSYEVYPNTGAIRSYTINQVGLYRTTPNVAPNSVPYSITEVYPTDGGSGYANGYIILQGGEPMMNGNTSITDFTYNVASIIANSGAVGVNSFVIFSGGGASNTPANARIFVNSRNYIVNVNVSANGTYSSPPTATVNTGNGVLTISTVIFSNANTGYATTNANVQIIVNSTGAIVRTIITNVGLYENVSNVNLNGAVESIVANSGARTVNSWITLSNPQTYGNTRLNSNVANARIFVNTAGYVVNVAVFANGIYYGTPTVTNLRYYENTVSVPAGSGGLNGQTSNAAFTITMGPSTIYAGNGVSQNGSGARFRISYNANTLNVANITTTLVSNTLYTATIALTANSNSTTNAAFTVYPVSNVQTKANITVGFVSKNTPASASIEVYDNSSGLMPVGTVNGAIRTITISVPGNYYYAPDIIPNSAGFITSITANSGAVGVNSFVRFTGGGTSNVAANARIFVNTAGYIVNVVITSNGTYTSTPTATPNTGNGVLTVIRSGVDADLRVNSKGIFTQTANNQDLIVYK